MATSIKSRQDTVSKVRPSFPRKISGSCLNSWEGWWSIDVEWAGTCKDDPRTTGPVWTAQPTKTQDASLPLTDPVAMYHLAMYHDYIMQI